MTLGTGRGVVITFGGAGVPCACRWLEGLVRDFIGFKAERAPTLLAG